jgi:hypothetical protein
MVLLRGWILQWLHHKTKFARYKVYLHKETHIIQNLTKNITILFYQRAVL